MKHRTYLIMTTFSALLLHGCQAQPIVDDKQLEETTTEPALFIQEQPIETQPLSDGTYFAIETDFSTSDGWKDTLTFEVKDGSIISVNIDAVNELANKTKKISSVNGTYPMTTEEPNAKAWHEQIEQIEKYLISNQNFDQLHLSEQGTTDAIAGVTIAVSDYPLLLNQALENGPIEKGPYQDGHYYAESETFDGGFKYSLNLNVINGYIVSVNWDGVSEDGTETKKETSKNGNYGMVTNGNAQSEWFEQAKSMENHLLEIQDPTLITYTEDNKTDAVSSVTIAINDFVELTIKALASGPLLD